MALTEIAGIVSGELHPGGDADVTVTAPAAVDSRLVGPGGLFVAIAGEHVDGHDYAAAAADRGAVAVLGTRPTELPTVVVDDPVRALGDLAREVRSRLGATVLAMTGSQGKTGTKDYLAQVLAAAGPTVATAGNHNNELGVPLTILTADADTRYLVVEMGARGVGHIRYLCDIAAPTHAAVLNVGTAHLGEFGSREAIAIAKGEIVEALGPDGVAVLNADDPLTLAMSERTAARVVTFGGGGDVQWSDVTMDDLDRPRGVLHAQGDSAPVQLQQVGAHQLANAAAAAGLALAAGMALPDVAAALSDAVGLSRWRMEVHERADGVVVVNDAYNANPDSMRAALDALAVIGERRSARTIAVLGEMAELGADAAADHRAIGRHAAEHGIDVVLGVGAASEATVAGALETTDSRVAGVCVPDNAAALAWLRENIRPGDVIVVKASRAAALETVAAGVLEETE